MLDKIGPKKVFLIVSAIQLVFFSLFIGKYDWAALIIALCFMLGAFGQIPINDFMIGKMAKSELRASIYGVRYIISFGVWAVVVPLISFVHINYGFDYLFYILAVCALYISGGLNPARQLPSDTLLSAFNKVSIKTVSMYISLLSMPTSPILSDVQTDVSSVKYSSVTY